MTVDHTEIQCSTIAGVGEDLKWQVTVQGQVNNGVSEPTTAYAKPVIASLDVAFNPDKTSDGRYQGPTNGGNTVVVSGENFGLADEKAKQRIIFDGVSLTPSDVFPNEKKVVFILPESYGKGKEIYLVIDPPHGGVAVQSVDPVMFDYISPYVSGVTVTQAKADQSQVVLTISGSNFCKGPTPGSESCGKVYITPEGASAQVIFPLPATDTDCSMKDGAFESVHSHCWTHERIEVRTPFKAGLIRVEVGGVSSTARAFTKTSPVIIKTEPPLAASSTDFRTSGGEQVKITGTFLGIQCTTTSSKTACDAQDPQPWRESLKVQVKSIPSDSCCDDDKELDPATATCKPACYRYAEIVSFFRTDSASGYTDADEPGELTFKMPEGQGTGQELRVLVDGQPSLAVTFNYKPPTVALVVDAANKAPVPPTEGEARQDSAKHFFQIKSSDWRAQPIQY